MTLGQERSSRLSFVFILPPLSISRRGQGKKFIWIDRPFDTGYCLIQVTAWEGLTVYTCQQPFSNISSLFIKNTRGNS